MKNAFWGQRIDAYVKRAVENDKDLAHLWVSKSGEFGPDFHFLEANTWWDVTTESMFQRHLDKYAEPFGYGIGVFR